MKIVFLGTGHGVPTAERACSCAMLEVNGALYYIDGGAPIVERTMLCGRDIREAKALFVTHAHGDHVSDVFHLADLINWYYKDMSFSFYFPERAAADAICALVSSTSSPIDTARISFPLATEGEVYRDENIRVTYHRTAHLNGERHSYGIIVEAEGKRICFSGDLSYHMTSEDFPEAAFEEIDLLVCELAHFGVEHIAEYLPRIKARCVAFQHVYPLTKYDDIANFVSGKYSFRVLTPSDMEEIEI